jgi:AMP nucleosidase
MTPYPADELESCETSEAVVEALEALHDKACEALRSGLKRFVETRQGPSRKERARYRYPLLRVSWHSDGPVPVLARAYAKFQTHGLFETTITQPRYFRSYLLEQLAYLKADFGASFEVGPSTQEIPYPYVLENGNEGMIQDIGRSDTNPAELARYFPAPLLSLVGDEIADGLFIPKDHEPRPLSLFDAVRVDYSLRRLVHYTGTDWQAIQPWILLTNYHRYVDQFVALALQALEEPDGRFEKLVLPGHITITRATKDKAKAVKAARGTLYQMPAWHLVDAEGQGVSLVNIGVGPSNAKNITDHLAVLRPHCWLMMGHCGGLRQSQNIGDYVLAHAYLREDGILDELLPRDIPVPALAEVQVALQEAVALVTGAEGEALKRRLRTGTVVTNDDRNWELRWSVERRRIHLSRAIAIDMESGTIAGQGYRLRVPYGALLCVSDKPLHGEIKLPGTASAFYEQAVGEHLAIGLAALELLRSRQQSLHSRKLRSFEEPPFR